MGQTYASLMICLREACIPRDMCVRNTCPWETHYCDTSYNCTTILVVVTELIYRFPIILAEPTTRIRLG